MANLQIFLVVDSVINTYNYPSFRSLVPRLAGRAWERGYPYLIFRRVRRARAKNLVWGQDQASPAFNFRTARDGMLGGAGNEATIFLCSLMHAFLTRIKVSSG